MAVVDRDEDGDVAGRGKSLWCAQMGAHLAKLQSDLNGITARGLRTRAERETAHKAQGHLDAARGNLEHRLWPPSSLVSQFVGGLPYAALANAHEAEVEILQLTPAKEMGQHFERILVQSRLHLQPDDPRLEQLEEQAGRAGRRRGRLSPRMKWVAIDALHAANEAEDSEKARMRDFMHMIMRYTLILVSLAVLTVLLFNRDDVKNDGGSMTDIFCFTPNERTVCPSGTSADFGDVLLISFFGLVGSALSGVVALRDMPHTAQPYRVAWWLLLLRLPIGILAAMLGIILIRADVIPGLTDLDTSAQILFWAATFGVLQETVTRAIDAHGRSVISNTRSSERGYDEQGDADSAGPRRTAGSTSVGAADGRGGGPGASADGPAPHGRVTGRVRRRAASPARTPR